MLLFQKRFEAIRLRKLAKPFVDLCIVITGVSVAFLLNNFNERKKEKAERKMVLTSLSQELKGITGFFPGMAVYQDSMVMRWDSLHTLRQIDDFYKYRYLQPQYNYSVIEYAIDTRNSNVVSFALHEQLLQLYKSIKMLEQAEIHMTNLALQYQAPSVDSKEGVSSQNLFLFDRFIVFAQSRAHCIRNVNDLARTCMLIAQPEETQPENLLDKK